MLRWDRIRVADDEIPPAVVLHEVWQPKRDHLASFLEICPGWRHEQILPPTYPQVAVAEMHLQILAHRHFPYNPMGIVHVSNHIDVLKPLSIDSGPFDIQVSLENWQPHRRGRLFDIRTSLSKDGALLWESVATALVMLHKKKRGGSSVAEKKADPDALDEAQDTIQVAEDLGRRYAHVAGDYNPIHQRAWMAKFFGFKRAIIHGMWTLAWAVHEPASRSVPGPMQLTGYFKRPVPMPDVIRREVSTTEDTSLDIKVFRNGLNKPSLEVTLTSKNPA